LHTLKDRPLAIPYRTTYWDENWGLCLPHGRLRAAIDAFGLDSQFEAVVESRLFDGALTYGECVLPGESTREILFTAHACHPAQANDNCSGLAVATWLARELMGRRRRRYTYRFLFAPATLGAIAWLAVNRTDRVAAGLVLANLGDDRGLVYKRSRVGTLDGPSLTDRAVAAALAGRIEERPFEPAGHDERQFCSPGFDLPIGRLTRAPEGEYAQYHTSDDNASLVAPGALAGALDALRDIVDALEDDTSVRSIVPHGEPQLGRRGLLEGASAQDRAAMQWVLSLADGRHSLLDIAEHASLPFRAVNAAAGRLQRAGLLEPIN
jgi:aminopeptidase-like protein